METQTSTQSPLLQWIFVNTGSRSFHDYTTFQVKMRLTMFPPQKTSRVQSVYISTYQQDILYLKYIFQARKTKSHANQFNHYITKYRRFLVQFWQPWKDWRKKIMWWLQKLIWVKQKRLPPIKDTGTFEDTGMIVSSNQIELRTLVVVKLNLWMF